MFSRKEVRLGLFVVLTLTAAFFVVNYLRGKGLLSSEYEYVAVYERVDGLKPSAFVNIRGYKAGTVKSVAYVPSSDKFEVVVSVNSDFSIPDDSVLEIYSSDIMGGKSVNVACGVSDRMASPGDTLAGRLQPDMMSSLMESLPSVAQKAGTMMDSVTRMVSSVNSVVASNSARVDRLVARLASAAEGIDRVVSEVGGMTPQLSELVCSVNSLADSLSSPDGDLMASLASIRRVSAQLEDARLAELSARASEILDSLAAGKGTAGMLLSDDSLYRSLDSLAGDISGLVNAIKENPKKYVRISVF